MDNTTTLNEKSFTNFKPSEAIVKNILNFSKAYSTKKLEGGLDFEMIKN